MDYKEILELIRFLPEDFQAAAVVGAESGLSLRTLGKIRIEAVGDVGLTLPGGVLMFEELALRNAGAFDVIRWLLQQRHLGTPTAPLFFRLQPASAALLRMGLALREAKKLSAAALLPAQASRRLPDFLVLGAPRCATTWLYDGLSLHPGIHLGREKEPEFFTDHRFSAGLDYYAEHFSAARADQIVGDISVGYLDSEKAISRIANTLSQRTKFVIMLRDPLQRARSYYEYRLQHTIAPPTFEESLTWPEYRHILVEQGKYAVSVDQWYSKFLPSQFHFILNDDIVEDPQKTMAKLLSFLGADAAGATFFPEVVNASRYVTAPNLYQNLRRAELVASASGGKLSLPIVVASRWLRSTLLSDQKRTNTIPPKIKRSLCVEFKPHTERLQSLINRDLSKWLKFDII